VLRRCGTAVVATALAPLCASATDIAISPASPHALDPVRLQVTEGGAAPLDFDATQVTMADGLITVQLARACCISPPLPAHTVEMLLGSFPEGTYQVKVIDGQGTMNVPVYTTAFTVTAPAANGAPLANLTDLWWNSSESGWGLNVVQHPSGNLFMTWFVYDASGKPVWYVVPGGTWAKNDFTGSVYRTTGPVLGEMFDPAAVKRTLAGSVTLSLDGMQTQTARILFSVDGQDIGRTITRLPY
jgi:hypothetical protein